MLTYILSLILFSIFSGLFGHFLGRKIFTLDDNSYHFYGHILFVFLFVIVTSVSSFFYHETKKNVSIVEENFIVHSTGLPSKEGEFQIGIFGDTSYKSDSFVSYLIRVEAEDGYRDMIIKDILIKEKKFLFDTGEFSTVKMCTEHNLFMNYFLFWERKIIHYTRCYYKSRVLSLPVGAIQKTLTI